jgi:hypothetical protein
MHREKSPAITSTPPKFIKKIFLKRYFAQRRAAYKMASCAPSNSNSEKPIQFYVQPHTAIGVQRAMIVPLASSTSQKSTKKKVGKKSAHMW